MRFISHICRNRELQYHTAKWHSTSGAAQDTWLWIQDCWTHQSVNGVFKRIGERRWRESQSQRARRGQIERLRGRVEEGNGARWGKGGDEGGKEGESERGVSLLKDINRRKSTWSLAVTLPDGHIHRSPLPFSSPPAPAPPPLICCIPSFIWNPEQNLWVVSASLYKRRLPSVHVTVELYAIIHCVSDERFKQQTCDQEVWIKQCLYACHVFDFWKNYCGSKMKDIQLYLCINS